MLLWLLLLNVDTNNGGREVTAISNPCVTETATGFLVVVVGCVTGRFVAGVTFNGRGGLFVVVVVVDPPPGTISLVNSSERDWPEISGFLLADSELIANKSINHVIQQRANG
jgi:hypothetical protein